VPEGDALHRAARRLQVIVGDRISAESPHPRARAERIAERVDGRRLEAVEAIGKNLVLRFEGGIALRSHLRMSGRWTVQPRDRRVAGRPWLVLRGARAAGILWNGPILELHTRALSRLGPDILERPPRIDAMLARLRGSDATRPLGEALLDQNLVAGIGNAWMAEALWAVELSPWQPLAEVGESDRRLALEAAARLMSAAVDVTPVPRKHVYARAGQPCPRCRTAISSWGLGDDNRTAYWCTACQGSGPGAARKARSRPSREAGDDPRRA
jgi:endonuclease-8